MGIVALTTYLLVPKVAVITTNKLLQLQYIVTEVLRYVPGSNNATGCVHVNGYPYYKIITKIVSGIPNYSVLDTRSGNTESLNIFIGKLIDAVVSSDNGTTDAVETIISASSIAGDVINIGGLI